MDTFISYDTEKEEEEEEEDTKRRSKKNEEEKKRGLAYKKKKALNFFKKLKEAKEFLFIFKKTNLRWEPSRPPLLGLSPPSPHHARTLDEPLFPVLASSPVCLREPLRVSLFLE